MYDRIKRLNFICNTFDYNDIAERNAKHLISQMVFIVVFRKNIAAVRKRDRKLMNY